MIQKPMDFNPLDILAAAALGQKDGSSDVATTGKQQTSDETASVQDAKDAEEDPEEEMGKTTKVNLKCQSPVKSTAESIMPPQKAPWSPDSFLVANQDDLNLKPGKISIIELMQDLENAAFGKKELLSEDPGTKDTEAANNSMISLKNAINSEISGSPIFENECNKKAESSSSNAGETGPNHVSEGLDQNSDTDTAESNDCSKCTDSAEKWTPCSQSISMDHSYSLIPGQPRPSLPLDQGANEEDDDVDICSQSSPLIEETEHRSQNLSLDCNLMKTGILEGTSVSTLDLCKMSSFGRGRLPSSSSSTSSPSHEMSSKGSKEEDTDSALCSTLPVPELSSPDKRAPKYGKFRIGTFASFSSNNLELEKFLRNKDSPPNNGRKLNIGIPLDMNMISSTINSPTASPSLHPLLHSPIQDWDRSEAGSEVHDDSSESRTPHRLSPDFTSEKVTEWSHPLFHDHDYCLKEGEVKLEDDDSSKLNLAKRKYTKKKSKLDLVNQEKILKAKYLKKELLKQEPPKRSTPEIDFSAFDSSVLKTNPVGRPKKRPLEKPIEEEIDPETGAKMKITGKFQDQYVYYLSKSSRTTSRRRQTPLPFPPDKIIVPAPKPGDIVVPHLTDADIETVRLKGRAGLNLQEKSPSSHPLGRLTSPAAPLPSQHGSDYDVDSHIVSTILSMENDNLSAAPSPDPPDITGDSLLNPNQPALTESLRLMSGDNSITSEHVLNYLLSVVKDDDVPADNILNGHGLDTSSSALFQPLPSESVYSKVDHLEQPISHTDDHSVKISSGYDIAVQDQSCINSHLNPLSNSIHTSHLQSSDSFTSPDVKGDGDAGHMSDSLSSFMPNSQGTTSSTSSSNTSQSVYSTDLSSLGTPQLSSSFPRLTSIEKTLDYLGVKDGDIKLEHNDILSSKLHSETDSSTLLTPESTVSTDDDTPWIVTVTLYFNDVPAIMVNNQPYIRLVDIHKQILPAKDTGILKKRCQLLKIPVLNCSEMQRYFLVQYGRAYNSKSTLIISKSQATELVTYYAVPQPRSGKLDEALQQGRNHDSSSGTGLSANGVPIKKKAKNRKNGQSGLLVPEELSTGSPKDLVSTNSDSSTLGSGKRTRHKKVNYLEMLKGEEKKSSEDSILETIECVIKGAPDYVEKHKNKSSSSSKSPSKKVLKKNGLLDKKKKRDNHKKRRNSKQHDQGPKGKKQESSVSEMKEEKIHIQDNEAWMRKLGSLVSDSEDSLDSSLGKSKFQPLKLKVNSLLNFVSQKKVGSASPTKKGLFSRSSSMTSTESMPLRVLAVAHQAAIPDSHLPSQPADIHLDLFLKSSSPCVRCQTCSQFLSVPHFMRHHHVPMDSEWLATEAAHRILVPRNKENISEQEKKLWEEFHTLQEAIGGFGEKDDDDSDSEMDSGDDYDLDDDPSSLGTSGASSILSSGRETIDQHHAVTVGAGTGLHGHSSLNEEGSSSSEDEDDGCVDLPSRSWPGSALTSPISALLDRQRQKMKQEMASRCGLVRRVPPVSQATNNVTHPQEGQNSHQRTSSRKRKSKQLFSIENYYSPKRTSQEEERNLDCYSEYSGSTNPDSMRSPVKGGRLSI